MNVVAICGSLRKAGNTARLLKAVIDAAIEKGATGEVLFLGDYDIKQCNGCLYCEQNDCRGYCSIKDDMAEMVVPKILAADALIIGTPSYFDLPSGLLKMFMDRSNMILGILSERKLPYAIVVVGQSDMTSLNAANEAVKRYCNICGMQSVNNCTLQVIARDIGDVDKDQAALSAAKDVGYQLVAGVKEWKMSNYRRK